VVAAICASNNNRKNNNSPYGNLGLKPFYFFYFPAVLSIGECWYGIEEKIKQQFFLSSSDCRESRGVPQVLNAQSCAKV
jgi:hypothetical protein